MPDPRSLAPDPASSTTSRLLACPECDLLMRQAPLAPGQSAQCVRCGYVLHTRRRHVVERSLALVLAALLLFGPANFRLIWRLAQGHVRVRPFFKRAHAAQDRFLPRLP